MIYQTNPKSNELVVSDFIDPPAIVSFLHDIEGMTLFLTGSRLFGNTHEESDWDFYTSKMNPNQIASLKSIGFKKEDFSTDALFGRTIEVWSYSDSDSEVHLLVVDDLKLRHHIQRVVREYFPDGYSDKSKNAKAIWSMAETIAWHEINQRGV